MAPCVALIMGKRRDNGGVYCAEWNSETLQSTLRQDLAGLFAAGCAYASVPRGIIACGGFLDDSLQVVAGDAVLLDVNQSIPLLLPKLNVERASHALVVVNIGTLTQLHWVAYCIGGFNGTTKCATVERYVLGDSKWEVMQSMSMPRSGHCAVAQNRAVYVFGGRSGYRVTNTGEYMHMQTDIWSPTKPMRVRGLHLVACRSIRTSLLQVDGMGQSGWRRWRRMILELMSGAKWRHCRTRKVSLGWQ
jgi:hypothetical protein